AGRRCVGRGPRASGRAHAAVGAAVACASLLISCLAGGGLCSLAGGPKRASMMAGSSLLAYRRVLLKLSGEALMGAAAYGINVPVVQRLSGEIRDVMASGIE